MTTQEALKRFRKEYKLSQKALCEEINICQPQYARYERNRDIPIELVKKICIEYNVSADYLLGLK